MKLAWRGDVAKRSLGSVIFCATPGGILRHIQMSPFARLHLNDGRTVIVPLGLAEQPLHHEVKQLLRWQGSWKSYLLQRLVPDPAPVLVDVGANLGQTLLEMYWSHPDCCYVGFEPNPRCLEYLGRLVRANGWEDARIIPAALGAKNGLVQLYKHRGSTTDSMATTLMDLRPGRTFDVNMVPMLIFDDLRPPLGIQRIDLIKIDVEGAELEVLRGMKETLHEMRPSVLCEVLFTDAAADLASSKARNEEMVELLRAAHYGVWRLEKSEDLKVISSVKAISEFPTAYWTHENAELCDYLFLPYEAAKARLAKLQVEMED